MEEASSAKGFPSPDHAFSALLEILESGPEEALAAALGVDPAGLETGNDAANALARSDFLAAARDHAEVSSDGAGSVWLLVGKERHLFPAPAVEAPGGWVFDTQAAIRHLRLRTIGENELATLATLRGMVAAQYTYRESHPENHFAGRLTSHPGERNGLCWPDGTGPAGHLLAAASREVDPEPLQGYFFRMLERQGSSAPGGEQGFGEPNEGFPDRFAILAWPAKFGESGRLTFMVSKEGIVYRKDFGERTAELAAAISKFDPDKAWKPVNLWTGMATWDEGEESEDF